MLYRYAIAAFAVASLCAATAHAELTLPPQLSPGVPALVTDPNSPAAEGEPGPREAVPPAKREPAGKASKPRKSTKPKRVNLDLASRGARRAVGMSYRFFDHLDIGYSGIFGRATGSEPHATLFTNLGRLRPMITAGVPIYPVKNSFYPGFRGAVGFEWRPSRFIGFYANLTAGYFGKALNKVEKSSLMPGGGLLLYL